MIARIAARRIWTVPLLVLVLFAPGTARATRPGAPASVDWMKFRFDNVNSGVNPFETTLNPSNVQNLHIKWTVQTGSYITSSPAVVGGVLYVGSWDHTVYALNADTGVPVWQKVTGERVLSSPTVVNGVVYVASFDDSVYALDASTGSTIWATPTRNWVESSPALWNGMLFVASVDSGVYGLDQATGARVWR